MKDKRLYFLLLLTVSLCATAVPAPITFSGVETWVPEKDTPVTVIVHLPRGLTENSYICFSMNLKGIFCSGLNSVRSWKPMARTNRVYY